MAGQGDVVASAWPPRWSRRRVLALVVLMAPAAQARPLRAGGGGPQLHAAAGEHRRRLRVHRRPGDGRLHAPVPGRLLHGRRSDQPYRPPRPLQRRNAARQRRRGTHRSRPLRRRRRLQPGLGDPRAGAGPRNDRRRRREQGGADQPHRPVQQGQRPGGRDRRPDGQALADLGRDQLGRRQTPPTAWCRSIRRSTSPPGTATSSPCATSRTPPTNRSKRPPASATTATTSPANRKPSTPAGRTSKNCSRSSKRRASSARACTWRGTSRSPATPTTANASSTCATKPSPSSATPTSPTASPRASRPASTSRKSKTNPTPGEIARRVKGTFEVPCFLFPSCETGGRMVLDSEGAPVQNGTWTANFDCIIPLSVTTGAPEQGRPALYGHGLLGSADEVASGPQRSLSENYKIVHCATDEIGMAESDVADRDRGAAERVGVPGDPRPPAAGAARRALPRARADHPERLHDRPRLPPGRHARQRLGPEHGATCTTTATARAASWGAP